MGTDHHVHRAGCDFFGNLAGFLRLLEAMASLWASFRAYAERRRASAARDALSAAPVRVLCGKLGGQPDNPAVAHTDEPASGDAGRD